ncbi:MAG: substrate-binding domain-containing protein [Kiloniellales bacterium]
MAQRSTDGEEPVYLTTHELADYLRIKERRIYELLRQRAIPATRVTGKWLFPKAEIDRWLGAQEIEGIGGGHSLAPPIVAGSSDPLLDWAVRESNCGLAIQAGGSEDGLARMEAGAAQAAGLHLLDSESGEYNRSLVQARLSKLPLILIEWAKRRQGLVVAAGNPKKIAGIGDLARRDVKVVRRPSGAGSQHLLDQLLAKEGVAPAGYRDSAVAQGETDLGLAILDGAADTGLAVEAVARALKLDFVPLTEERYDLLIERRAFFEPPLQRLFAFARTAAFATRAKALGGYDLAHFGTVHYNGP